MREIRAYIQSIDVRKDEIKKTLLSNRQYLANVNYWSASKRGWFLVYGKGFIGKKIRSYCIRYLGYDIKLS